MARASDSAYAYDPVCRSDAIQDVPASVEGKAVV